MSGAGANDSQFANSGTEPRGGTVDAAEIARFNAMAADWWDPTGKFRPLHKFNPVRLGYIKQQVSARFARDDRSPDAFKGLKFLDIGCGGGLLCEPMARLVSAFSRLYCCDLRVRLHCGTVTGLG